MLRTINNLQKKADEKIALADKKRVEAETRLQDLQHLLFLTEFTEKEAITITSEMKIVLSERSIFKKLKQAYEVVRDIKFGETAHLLGYGDYYKMRTVDGVNIKDGDKFAEVYEKCVEVERQNEQIKAEKIKIEDKEAQALKSFDLETSKSENLGYGLEGSQDFIWLDKNYLLMARGNSIYRRKTSEKTWELVATIPIQTHQNISRMAYSADLNLLVLTMERKQSPQ
jgi:hypothetical protein